MLARQRLTVQEERQLVIAAGCGDAAARRQLVEAFLPAIANLAHGFQGSRVDRRELLQEGVAGLLSAAHRYDSQLETPFWAYASFWVRKAMQELVAQLSRPVALSDRASRELSRIRRVRTEHLQRAGRELTVAELSAVTGLQTANVESLLATDRVPRGIEERLSAADPLSATIAETIADPRAAQAFEQVLDDHESQAASELTNELEDRERLVIRSHYGLGQRPRTLSEIGAGLGVTAERARQIEVAALTKLRRELA